VYVWNANVFERYCHLWYWSEVLHQCLYLYLYLNICTSISQKTDVQAAQSFDSNCLQPWLGHPLQCWNTLTGLWMTMHIMARNRKCRRAYCTELTMGKHGGEIWCPVLPCFIVHHETWKMFANVCRQRTICQMITADQSHVSLICFLRNILHTFTTTHWLSLCIICLCFYTEPPIAWFKVSKHWIM